MRTEKVEIRFHLFRRQRSIATSLSVGGQTVREDKTMNYGRFVYYQPNDKDIRDKVGDCQIRALSKVLNKTWLETFDLITPICREQQTMDIFSCDLNKTKEAMQMIGFQYTGISNKKGSKRPTVESFAKAHKSGKIGRASVGKEC